MLQYLHENKYFAFTGHKYFISRLEAPHFIYSGNVMHAISLTVYYAKQSTALNEIYDPT